MVWTFRCYIEPRQRERPKADQQDIVEQWVSKIDNDGFAAKLDTRLKYLAQQPRSLWELPSFRLLHGDCDGLGELRFLHDRVQQRLLGAATGEAEYTWLFAATEKGGKLVPKVACKIALMRLDEVIQDRSNARACDRN
ncbi:hypothetical protein [Sphingomonas aurantiaca]|uniref:hypothetical protein n=1 Tax=Sphingomonas aurantiaca TaxID=185949 RepID=UPI003364EF56